MNVKDVLAELERRGMAAHSGNPDYSKGMAEAYELVAALAPSRQSVTPALQRCWWCSRAVTCQPHRRGNYKRTSTRYQVVCHGRKCHARGPIRDTEQEAIDAHNMGPSTR